ncbi:MAG: helix-turn-helix domain-containing protein [Nitrospiraceae bacterium]
MRQRFFTVREVAQYVRRSDFTVRRWIHAGRLNGVRFVGDGYLVPVRSVKALLTEGLEIAKQRVARSSMAR